MRRTQLDRFYQRALDWTQAESPVDWAIYDPHKFDRLSSQTFVENYCWVIYVSGFEVAVVKSHWPSIQSAYKEFELSKLVRMRGVSKQLLKALSIKNEKKALGFLNGCRIVADWGWEQYIGVCTRPSAHERGRKFLEPAQARLRGHLSQDEPETS